MISKRRNLVIFVFADIPEKWCQKGLNELTEMPEDFILHMHVSSSAIFDRI